MKERMRYCRVLSHLRNPLFSTRKLFIESAIPQTHAQETEMALGNPVATRYVKQYP